MSHSQQYIRTKKRFRRILYEWNNIDNTEKEELFEGFREVEKDFEQNFGRSSKIVNIEKELSKLARERAALLAHQELLFWLHLVR